MTKRSTKSALLMSGLAILLCFSMLIGSTFAWFTDTVTSSGNKIVAGKLDIELWMHNGTEYVNISADEDPVFGEGSIAQNNNAQTVWEPGKTQVAYLQIKNNGNLALKYTVSLEVENVAGDLYEVMQYAIIPDAEGPNGVDAWNAANGKSVVVGAQSVSELTELKVGETHSFALAIHMKEEAGNTYQEGKVNFDLKIFATQLDYESDSFDDQYDVDLEPGQNGISKVLADGSTAFYYSEESGFGDRVRLIGLPENLGNEYTVPSEINDLGGALAGITLDKLTVPAGLKYAKKSLQGATIGEVVIADGATVIPDRLFYQANVDTVVIPDSITKIEQYAFSQAHPTTLVIPASVTTLEEGAFAYMPNLESVIFEGDATLPKFLLRACPELATVEIKGDVTVVTTNMVFSNYETGGKDNMTFYVNSEENAKELISCLGAYNDTNTGDQRNQWTVYIEEARYVNVKNATELQNALTSATTDTIINLTADITGTVEVDQQKGLKYVIDGNSHGFNGTLSIDGNASGARTESLLIKNINFTTSVSGSTMIKNDYNDNRRYAHNVTVENCTFTATAEAKYTARALAFNAPADIIIKDCEATGVHSFIQNKGHTGTNAFVVDNVKLTDCKNGMAFGTNFKVYVKNCDITSVGDFSYGIRGDANTAGAYEMTVENCKISADVPVQVRKVTAGTNYTLNIQGEDNEFIAGDSGYQIIGTSTEYADNVPEVLACTGTFTVNGADGMTVFK